MATEGSELADRYQPIENDAIIGDLHTVALVGMDGAIDFLSFPGFDSPTLLARLLDNGVGGHFSIRHRWLISRNDAAAAARTRARREQVCSRRHLRCAFAVAATARIPSIT